MDLIEHFISVSNPKTVHYVLCILRSLFKHRGKVTHKYRVRSRVRLQYL